MSKRKKRNLIGKITLAIFVVLLLAAIFTNPDKAQHKKAFQQRATATMDEIIQERNDALLSKAWQFVGANLLSKYIESNVERSNYGFFSLTKILWDREKHVVGVGVFGKVFITKKLDKDLIRPFLEEKEKELNNWLSNMFK